MSTVIISEMLDPDKQLFGMFGVEDFLADGIVHLLLEKDDRRVNLFLSIVKMRKTNHDRGYFPLIFEGNKFEIVTDSARGGTFREMRDNPGCLGSGKTGNVRGTGCIIFRRRGTGRRGSGQSRHGRRHLLRKRLIRRNGDSALLHEHPGQAGLRHLG